MQHPVLAPEGSAESATEGKTKPVKRDREGRREGKKEGWKEGRKDEYNLGGRHLVQTVLRDNWELRDGRAWL